MKVLTLWQPWATLVALGIKQHETRSWSTKYRGTLAIHAAKRPIGRAGQKLLKDLQGLPDHEGFGVFLFGVIVAVVDLVNVEPIPIRPGIALHDWMCGDWTSGRYAWKLKNVRRCEVDHKGSQGLRDLHPEVAAHALLNAMELTRG